MTRNNIYCIYLAFLVASLLSIPGYGQFIGKRHLVSTEFVQNYFNEYNLNYGFNTKQALISIEGALNKYTYAPEGEDYNSTIKGKSLGIAYRYYRSDLPAPAGFYSEIKFTYINNTLTDSVIGISHDQFGQRQVTTVAKYYRYRGYQLAFNFGRSGLITPYLWIDYGFGWAFQPGFLTQFKDETMTDSYTSPDTPVLYQGDYNIYRRGFINDADLQFMLYPYFSIGYLF